MMRWLKKRRGQGTLEYVMLLSAVIAAILIAVAAIKTKLGTGLDKAATKMESSLEEIFGSGGESGGGG